ncbi:cytochrome d ubiquinol oxidase subunit II [Candidatus Nitrospira allomarina]|jgi:cytochrome bd ubiquinol oxidase subunit II|uniref:Cytochrome d ubiquinol oxidase subunit II n=1 Tax=Candidatus Nitrospira allomarina TaxID=3020900 RepID=A0AA96G8V4_9BACT|nr:cytochrome d ubiquinol oxidase subunit II [Candidatus Nitrospira allomarina]WNM56927.1 cytochrome d ubiquinol oxidase subunit II [Candidatus Nitrospira allomarina]
METFWYVAVTLMLAVFVVLDGFDFGLGIVYAFVAKNETDRRAALAAIGPIWNGNEVWLIAAGGLLFFAFPKAYSAGFSGFYLALHLVLWLLIARGLALELRSHVDHALWRQFWDVAFAGASLLLAVVFGVALGNLIRGVPLNSDGYFFVALWTNFMTGPEPGILDWFTVLIGATSAAILAMHGANFLAMKTEGQLRNRARRAAWLMGSAVVILVGLALTSVPFVQPLFFRNYAAHPVGYIFPVLSIATLLLALMIRRRNWDAGAFSATSLLILTMLGSTAWGSYPNILIATNDPANSLTVTNATAGLYGLQIGLWWFLVGFILLIAYQACAHQAFRGKVKLGAH